MTTSARATVTIEIRGLGTWGPDCQLSQVYKQAEETALGKIRKFNESEHAGIRIVGDVKITAILVEDEK